MKRETKRRERENRKGKEKRETGIQAGCRKYRKRTKKGGN